jgi:hypothetical protein
MLKVQRIAPDAAAAALAGVERLDPSGMSTAASLSAACRRCECFEVVGPAGRAVYAVTVVNGVAWVEAAQGDPGPVDWTAVLDGVIGAQAGAVRSLATQTARPGLVRKLRRHGWNVAGWIMSKDMQR